VAWFPLHQKHHASVVAYFAPDTEMKATKIATDVSNQSGYHIYEEKDEDILN